MKKLKIELSIEEAASICAALQGACIQCEDSKFFEEVLSSVLEQVIFQLT